VLSQLGKHLRRRPQERSLPSFCNHLLFLLVAGRLALEDLGFPGVRQDPVGQTLFELFPRVSLLGDAAVLHDDDSERFREILPPFLKPSQNQIGELLLHTLGLLRAGVGRADSGRAVIERQLAAWGADTAGFAVRDGSGLSRHDYVSPETIVRVLDAMRTHQDFRVFYDALPIAGVDGTIATRMRGTPAERNVHAKTGTVDKARSLSGFVTTADGRLLIFSFLCNNFTVPNREVERVQDAILARLAGAPFLR